MFQPLQDICVIELELRKREYYELEVLNELTMDDYDTWASSAYHFRYLSYFNSMEGALGVRDVEDVHGSGLSIYVPDSVGNCADQGLLAALSGLVTSIPSCD